MFSTALIHDTIAREAARLIDDSKLLAAFDEWDRADNGASRQSASALSNRTILIAWYCVALEGSPLHLRNVAELLSTRLSPAAAELMGLPAASNSSLGAMSGRVQRATQQLLAMLDYLPMPTRQRRLTEAEWEATLTMREGQANLLEVKRRRFLRLASGLLGAQHDTLPAEVRSGKTNVSIDAAFIAANGKRLAAKQYAELGAGEVETEPDAGFYLRSYRTNHGEVRACGYGWEVDLLTLFSSDPHAPHAVPNITIGFKVHKPGEGSTRGAAEAFDELSERGIELGYVVGDPAHVQSTRTDILLEPLRERGASLVMKYAAPQEGTVLDSSAAGVLVEGRWYVPALPQNLAQACAHYREECARLANNPDLTTAERKERRSELKRQRDEKLLARQPYELHPQPHPRSPFEQDLAYSTPEWQSVYSAGRQATESYVTGLKYGESRCGRPEDRGLKGEVANAFLVLLSACATNAHRIRDWNAQRA